MRYGSVSSGIECAAIAWAPLGWQPAFLAEIDPFASTVLHHHHSSGRPRHMPSPDAPGLSEKDRRARRNAIKAVASLPDRANGVPNYGDMTSFEEWPDAAIDLLIGGTPCQSYSVAGLRKGLDDPRGDLTLTYAAIARRYRPRWLVWENVFGVLSHDGGRSFASLLGLLSGRRVEVPQGGWKSAGIVEGYERAYGLAWRVLDTQYVRVDGFGRALPQRRRRVFVVGYLGDWRRAAAVLLEREGLSGNPAPRRSEREGVAGTVAGGARGRGGYSADDIPLTAGTLTAAASRTRGAGVAPETLAAFGGGRRSGPVDVAACLTAKGQRIDFEVETFLTTRDVASTLTRGAESGGKGGYAGRRQEDDVNLVAHTLRADGFDASEDGSGRGTPLVPVHFQGRGSNLDIGQDVAGTIGCNADRASGGAPCICFNSREDPEVTFDRSGPLGSSSPQAQAIAYGIDSDCFDRSGEGASGTAGERAGLGITEGHTNALRAKRPGAVAVVWSIMPQNSGRDFKAREVEVAQPLMAGGPVGGNQGGDYIQSGWAVRRLVWRECCRLQGVPDDYFNEVVWRGKSPPPDGPIYKTLGNGFSANAVRWIGRRIEMVEAILRELEAGRAV